VSTRRSRPNETSPGAIPHTRPIPLTPRGTTWTDDEVRGLGVRTNVETAASILGMGRNQAYAALERGDFPVPTFKIAQANGRTKIVVPMAGLRRLLGIDESNHSPESVKEEPSSSSLTEFETPSPTKGSGLDDYGSRRFRPA
jgi:hypothetical protein